MTSRELKDVELFVFTDNLVFTSVFYKGIPKILLRSEIVLSFHQVYTRGYLILHMVHMERTIIIESVIDGLSRGNNLGGIMRGFNPQHFVPLDQLAAEIPTGV